MSKWGSVTTVRARRSLTALAATLLSALLGACVDPLDVTGVGEVVSEVQEQKPLEDDVLSDKHPVYAASRTVLEEFAGCQVTLNKSASVTRLTLQSSGALDEALKGKRACSRPSSPSSVGSCKNAERRPGTRSSACDGPAISVRRDA